MIPPSLPNLKHLKFGGAGAVETTSTVDLVQQAMTQSTHRLDDEHVHQQFVEQYLSWIQNSKLNQLQGLDAFGIHSFSAGTTESFDKFYMKNRLRRFRIFRGEYMYHAGTWKNGWDWAYMDQDHLQSNDAVIISLPFSDTGNIHSHTEETLDHCRDLGIPVLIDCAFFGLCNNINFNLDHPAITDVTFSLSKAVPVQHLRIGMRLTRIDDDDSLQIYNKNGYVNRFGAAVGIEILNNITADTNWYRWQPMQKYFCELLDVEPSSTVIFGLDNKEQFQQYNRGGNTNRLCFYRHMGIENLKELDIKV